MNKIIIMVMLGISSIIVATTYAGDLDDLDALLNDVGGTTTEGASISGDTITTEGASISGDTATIEDTVTGNDTEDTTTEVIAGNVVNVSTGSIDVSFNKVGDYIDYKVYYSKVSDENNIQEQEVKLGDGENTKQVTISGLDPDTEYQFIIKAFDNEGNPVESTASDPIKAKTNVQEHAAPADNVVYDPVLKVDGSKIIVSYRPGVDVEKVQISLSKDGKVFKTITTLDATKKTYTINTETTGKKYVKLVPISKDGTLGVCKVGTSDVDFVTANIQPKKVAKKVMGEPKTGPETYLLIILAIFAYIVYAIRKQRA